MNRLQIDIFELEKISNLLDKLGVSPSVMHCLYRQPAGRAFPADFRSRGRRRSPDRLTSAQTKLHQGLLRALPKDLRRAYLACTMHNAG